mgnify:CR=1 FL=1
MTRSVAALKRLDPRSAALFECTEPAPLVTDLTDKILPEDRPARLAALQAAREGHKPYRVDYRIQLADGRVRWLSTMGDIMRDDTGRPVRLVGIVLDASERKQAEAALRESDRRKDEFLATLAHELRNPLAPIKNSLELLLAHADPHTVVSEACATMDRQLRQMVRLIDDLLDVSRITRGVLKLQRQRVAVADVLRDAVETARPACEQAGHQLAMTLPSETIWLDADHVRLAQVFGNLLTNACKFTPSGGRIELNIEHCGAALAVTVADTGWGIPAEKLDSVFDMFTQAHDTSLLSSSGLGIGLAISGLSIALLVLAWALDRHAAS